MKFKDRKQKLNVCETMASLLCPMKEHMNERTKESIEITLRMLSETEVENEAD